MQVNPNPNYGNFQVFFQLDEITPTTLTLISIEGKIIEEINLTDLKIGSNSYQSEKSNETIEGTFFLKITTKTASAQTITRHRLTGIAVALLVRHMHTCMALCTYVIYAYLCLNYM
jgi:hypothetical protein